MDALDLWLEESWGDRCALRLKLNGCLHAESTPFQRLAVYDSPLLGRILALGGRLVLSESAEAAYAEGLAHSAIACHPAARRVLILGGGDGGVAREAARYPQVERIVVIEIDAAVTAASRNWFPACAAGLDDPRVELVFDDAHRYLAEHADRFDVIVVDGAELAAPAADLVHPRPFAPLLCRRLAHEGILVAPLGNPALDPAACRTALAALRAHRKQLAVYRSPAAHLAAAPLAVAWTGPALPAEPLHPPPGSCRHWTAQTHRAAFALSPELRETLGLGD